MGSAVTPTLSISIVIFRPDLNVLRATLRSLRRAANAASEAGKLDLAMLDLIDNGSSDPATLDRVLDEQCGGVPFLQCRVVRGHGNLGYGRGHNLSIHASEAQYHLVLNPDVELDFHALTEGLTFLEANPEVGLVAPEVSGPDGRREYLCRRYPSMFVLFLRGFAPASLQARFREPLDRYEMRDLIGDRVVKGILLASGCFMLARGGILRDSGGFSPRYFLYFEDYDLSLRLRRRTDIAYVPSVRIVHLGGDAASKGAHHTLLFVRSALTFFWTHGWKLA
jgi:GT2 family glycosyltransferase